ncbi:metal ABC transporter permease [Flexivirga caeni]|uniref:Metal ABC transporter permease n=1 Tax=Flexivirga caeni TaxID=2294115 RepID=A0A3M9MEF7_9MICO|nr:metal ABC transporter permease [Flexivirga caeni]RNI23962.1 metal ABC transporter permease [Flexivirga caeni]
MFTGFMVNTWIVASIVALIAGVVGSFVVMRGTAFAAHAIPQGAFAGAALAGLIGVDTILGLGVFSVIAALGIGWLGRRGRHDVAVALSLVVLLALGSLFLSWNTDYEPEIFSLLFGEVLGISSDQVAPTVVLAVVTIALMVVLFRPLLFSSVLPEVAEATGLSTRAMDLIFLIVLALATSMTLPVVGALLIFSLMIGPPAAARSVTANPMTALGISVVLSLVTVWVSIALAYQWNLPVGFFVGTISALWYAVGRAWLAWTRRRRRVAGDDVAEVTVQAAPLGRCRR